MQKKEPQEMSYLERQQDGITNFKPLPFTADIFNPDYPNIHSNHPIGSPISKNSRATPKRSIRRQYDKYLKKMFPEDTNFSRDIPGLYNSSPIHSKQLMQKKEKKRMLDRFRRIAKKVIQKNKMHKALGNPFGVKGAGKVGAGRWGDVKGFGRQGKGAKLILMTEKQNSNFSIFLILEQRIYYYRSKNGDDEIDIEGIEADQIIKEEDIISKPFLEYKFKQKTRIKGVYLVADEMTSKKLFGPLESLTAKLALEFKFLTHKDVKALRNGMVFLTASMLKNKRLVNLDHIHSSNFIFLLDFDVRSINYFKIENYDPRINQIQDVQYQQGVQLERNA